MTADSKKRNWLRVLIPLVVAVVSGCAYIDAKQGEWIFRPTEATWWGARELPQNFVELSIPVAREGAASNGAAPEQIHAWWVPAPSRSSGEPAPVLLYLHGARWNLTGSVSRIPRWNQMGFSVLAIDYRGFGKSSPRSPTEQSSNEDAEAAWRHLATLAPNAKKFIFGHSLGGSMAIHLALQHPDANGLILEGAFTSIPEMVKTTQFGFLPVGGLITQRFDNIDRIDDVKIPLLIAHGTEDAVVPFNMGERLYAAATAPKRFFKAEGGSHHNMVSRYFDEYADAVTTFFGLARVKIEQRAS
jgi:alpha-beta hydrolase superfamily lysophospholipase